jgi:predicted TIM-barrel fold metal-dependent hydrolase
VLGQRPECREHGAGLADQLEVAVRLLRGREPVLEVRVPQVTACESTVFALEHAGWPDTPDPGHRAVWRAGLESLAALANVHCKISGLAMTLQTVEAPALRPYVETCIEVFGVDRCLFGSNFPVDVLFGSFSDLLGSYIEITKGLGETDMHKLFVSNAQRLYRV